MSKEIKMVIDDLEYFGECFIGYEVQGEKAKKRFRKIRKAVENQYCGKISVLWDGKTGIARLA